MNAKLVSCTNQQFSYSVYGYTAVAGAPFLLGFAGQPLDPLTGCYLLGLGHRAFNPTLMRFLGPDYLSPFGAGGINCYAYCLGDPLNRVDPSGRNSKTVQLPRKRPDVLRQLLDRPLHGTRVSPPVRAINTEDMRDYFAASDRRVRPDLYRRVTESARHLVTEPHGDIPQTGLLEADRRFLEDTVWAYARQEAAHRDNGRLNLESVAAANSQLGRQRFNEIANRRIEFLQGEREVDPGDPARLELLSAMQHIRI